MRRPAEVHAHGQQGNPTNLGGVHQLQAGRDPKDGDIQELPLFPGDSLGGASAINDRDQVVGGSGSVCPLSVTSANHALLWQDGSVIDLGSLGGETSNLAIAINNRGLVAGFSDVPGDTTAHAFLWQNGVMTDLGTLPALCKPPVLNEG